MRIVARWPRLALRRLIAVGCALAFLLVGFGHTAGHAEAAVPVMASQAGGESSGESPKGPAKMDDIGIDQCHGCAMVGIPVAAAAAPLGRIETAYPANKAVSLRPYPPTAETPPPISES